LTIQNSKEVKIEDIQKAEPLKLEIEDFLKSVTLGTKPTVEGVEGLEILKIALIASTNNFKIVGSSRIKVKTCD
jgi:hypothetical protein